MSMLRFIQFHAYVICCSAPASLVKAFLVKTFLRLSDIHRLCIAGQMHGKGFYDSDGNVPKQFSKKIVANRNLLRLEYRAYSGGEGGVGQSGQSGGQPQSGQAGSTVSVYPG